MWSKVKLGFLVVLGIVALIIVFQNWSEVEVRLLFVKVAMPQAVLILSTIALGFVMGLIANTFWKMQSWRAKSKRKNAAAKATQADGK